MLRGPARRRGPASNCASSTVPHPAGERDAERDVQSEHVEERQRREPDIVRADPQARVRLDLTDVRGEVAVA